MAILRASCTPDSDYDGAAVVFGELTANVVRHASGPISIAVRFASDGTVILDVGDSGSGFEFAPTLPSVERDGGRGLYLVSQLCDHVSTLRTKNGNVVRVRLPVTAVSQKQNQVGYHNSPIVEVGPYGQQLE